MDNLNILAEVKELVEKERIQNQKIEKIEMKLGPFIFLEL